MPHSLRSSNIGRSYEALVARWRNMGELDPLRQFLAVEMLKRWDGRISEESIG